MNNTPTNCTFCKRKQAFFQRPYSGEKLCKECFITSLEKKVKATIAKNQMLHFEDRVGVAVSGGKDSISLLHVLVKFERRFPKASLQVITVDEGIRGYSSEALQIAIENCKKLGVEHHVVSFKELYGYSLDEVVEHLTKNNKEGLKPCAYCGVMRRRALNIAARAARVDKIATAHTLDDEVQTSLLNIFHGNVLRIAREKPVTDTVHPKLVQKIKPLCKIPEKETALYAYIKKIKFQSKLCPYASEALRNDVRTMLNRMEEKHAGMKFVISKSVDKIRQALKRIVMKEDLAECCKCGEPTTEKNKSCKICQMLKSMP